MVERNVSRLDDKPVRLRQLSFPVKLKESPLNLKNSPINRLNVPLTLPFLFTHMSGDGDTRRGLNEVRNILDWRGAIVLDLDHDGFSIAISTAELLKNLRARSIVTPASIKTLEDPMLEEFYTGLDADPRISIYPVYRMSAMADEEEQMMYAGLSCQEIHDLNEKYIKDSIIKLPRSKTVVIGAGFGRKGGPVYVPLSESGLAMGEDMHRERIGLFTKDGIPVIGIFPGGYEYIIKATGAPVLCTVSVGGSRFIPHNIPIPAATYLSCDLLWFDPRTENHEFFSRIKDAYSQIITQNSLDIDLSILEPNDKNVRRLTK